MKYFVNVIEEVLSINKIRSQQGLVRFNESSLVSIFLSLLPLAGLVIFCQNLVF